MIRAGALASLGLATTWLNSSPLTAAGLHGRVVLVDFWTYTCINWLRTLPYVRAWEQRYREHGLVVIGVHAPEFEFEHDLDNVRHAVARLRVDHPVAVDNDFEIWTAFDNHYWPARYLVDGRGRIRHHTAGEGEYEQSEAAIQRLLAGSDGTGVGRDPAPVDATGLEAAANWESLWSPENYLGSERSENFASRNGAVLGTRHRYSVPPRLSLNQWALSGDWTITRQAVELNQAKGTIAYRFHARDVHLVMAPSTAGGSVGFRVRLDGRPPGDAHGLDVDDRGDGTVSEARLFQLIRQPGPVTERTFEVEFLDPGVRAYAFTFG
ncbi:thioredoxin [Virgisporangium aurantiacum]|uniref:thioredoxin n=1 Tax=Virgisporangium aurantiacum TaxID=175570 RepID=UPI001EF3AB95|nr:thioredoxin [Virgisporangium aurantiacum]